ncbi:MAG: ATP-dependent Clp protease ATP-binding subunit [Acidobacteriota bacterium]
MQKEQLLNLLGPQARAAFEEAKRLARTRGGLLSPLHLVAALIESVPANDQAPNSQRARLLEAASLIVTTHFPAPSESLTVTKETQAVITSASRVAEAEGCALVTPLYLLRAALASATARKAFREVPGFEPDVMQLFGSAPQALGSSASTKASPDSGPGSRRGGQIAGVLGEYCSDLAEESRAASSHPFVGREREITAVLETLCRKLKNNPLLIGKPGVGKTALVIAVAERLCDGNVPLRLRGKRVLEVSRLRLLADAKFSGDIEERLKKLLEEVRSAGDVILFFDEIHTLLSAGGAGGTGDIANLLKSSLSKGEITCIGATTLAEYYKYIARDEALARRFSTITIEEPSREEAGRILNETRSAFEAYHGVTIDEEMVSLIVEMADRFLHSRSFPDKAFDLLDRAAAKATLSEQNSLTREIIAETLSETTGLPLEIMDEDPAGRLERLEEFLNGAVPGQQRAARDVARVVRIAKLGLEIRPEQPDGVFLFAGPEGVGKHEMATALARFLYGSANKLIEFDMSQFTEAWSISRLIGAEPGYVGYSERSGLLSKAAEDNPHSLLFFRNIDLAHPVVQQFLGEALERGRFTDAAGARISLSNTTVVMALSPMTESGKHGHMGFMARNGEPGEHQMSGSFRFTGSLNLRERGSGYGLAEWLAATIDEVIEFQVLDRAATETIIGERLDALRARLEASQPVRVNLDPELAAFFAQRLAAERKSLAQLERLLQETIIIPFTQLHIDRHAVGARPEVAVRVENSAVKLDAVSRT